MTHDHQEWDNAVDCKLQREGGVTQISLSNGRKLKQLHGRVVKVYLYYARLRPDWPPDYLVRVTYADGTVHDFTGFSWGYGGEGPRGLRDWAAENDVPLDGQRISSLPNDRHREAPVWGWAD